MRYFLFVLFWLQMLMPCGATGEAKRLSRLDARTRDSVMVARVQRLMMTKRPWLYRRDIELRYVVSFVQVIYYFMFF